MSFAHPFYTPAILALAGAKAMFVPDFAPAATL